MREKERKSNAGRKAYDSVMMVKIVILQSLYNLSDAQMEQQILDRLSFMRFLGLSIGDNVPDEKTIWAFKEGLAKAGLAKELFTTFDKFLRKNGFEARKGQIVDASLVSVPKQRNTREENKAIKKSGKVDGWDTNKACQKDTDARWTVKNGNNYYGYKNHICIDVEHKLIRGFEVTNASVHDSNVFVGLLDKKNSSMDVGADSAYRSSSSLKYLEENGYREHIQRKGNRGKKLTQREIRGNHTRSRIRSRVEHIFGVQAMRMGNCILRGVGIFRAQCKIALRNLAYNLSRYSLLQES